MSTFLGERVGDALIINALPADAISALRYSKHREASECATFAALDQKITPAVARQLLKLAYVWILKPLVPWPVSHLIDCWQEPTCPQA